MSSSHPVIATSRSTIRQHAGAHRSALIPPQKEPVDYGIHGGILAYYREKYGFEVDREMPATLDHMIAAVAG
ncbi:MAG: hypothetical protein O2865_10575 [Planctomycetota bacterium]|nr:hypothetical protein [Planctomycetota bacterium]MDA1221015.1 hypothetical protein [Planctomycetota bacterium]